MQAGEAREMMRPATVSDLIPANAPPEIQALIVAENNIEGQPSVYDRWKASTGITEGENGVLMRNGKPMPYYAFRSPRYQGVFTDIMKGAIKADKYADFKSAREGGEPLTPGQKINALRKQGQQIRYLLENAARRGDEIGAKAFMRDAQDIKERIQGLEGALEEERKLQQEKDLYKWKQQNKSYKPTDFESAYNQWVADPENEGKDKAYFKNNIWDKKDTKPEYTPGEALEKIQKLEQAKVRLQQTGGIGDVAYGFMMALDPTGERAKKAREDAEKGDLGAAEKAIDDTIAYLKKFAPDNYNIEDPDVFNDLSQRIVERHPEAKFGIIPGTEGEGGRKGFYLEKGGDVYEIRPKGL